MCTTCKTSKRADVAYGKDTPYRCPICHGKLFELPQNRNIPRQAENDEWQRLRIAVLKMESELIPRMKAAAQERIAKIDCQIAGLLKKTPSEERDTKIGKLRWRRREAEAEGIGPSSEIKKN